MYAKTVKNELNVNVFSSSLPFIIIGRLLPKKLYKQKTTSKGNMNNSEKAPKSILKSTLKLHKN